MLTCSGSLSGSDPEPFYLQYYPLWKHLLQTRKTMQVLLFFTETQWKSIESVVYDELISAVIKLLQKLDLSYSIDSNDQSNLKPNKPKDFELFCNLVEFCKLVLPQLHTDTFTKWIYVFGKELISRSSNYPLISGFYKLLAIVLKVAGKEKYFDVLSNSVSSTADMLLTNRRNDVAVGEPVEQPVMSYMLFNKV